MYFISAALITVLCFIIALKEERFGLVTTTTTKKPTSTSNQNNGKLKNYRLVSPTNLNTLKCMTYYRIP